MILDCDGASIYENKIEECFHEYFEMRGIELENNGYKSIPTNVFQAAFRYIYKKLFKPGEDDNRRYKTKSLIDYSDAYTLERIVDIYGDLVLSYNIKATQNMFCDMTGINRDTLWDWERGSSRAYIYKYPNGEIIPDIRHYLYLGGKDYVKELSTSHSDLVKKIKSFSYMTAYNSLNDTPVGQITHANNSKEAGMEYNQKREIETKKAQLMSLEELSSRIGELSQNGTQLLDVID